MKLLVTRHGETIWNARDLVCGHTDIELTQKGMEQAIELGKKLASYSIDRIFVSPLKRALATSRIAEHVRYQLLERQNLPSSTSYHDVYHLIETRKEQNFPDFNPKRPPIIIEPRLKEQCYGIYEGESRLSEGFANNKKQFAFRYPGGESQIQTAHRIYGLIEELAEKYPEETVLLVCHGGICRVLHTYFTDMTNDEFFHFGMPNCGLYEYMV